MLFASFFLFIATGVAKAESPTSLRPSERETAAKIDAALEQTIARKGPLPALVDDETFLRRLSFDLTGKLPRAEDARRFVSDMTTNKRNQLIDRLLQSDEYAVNWGRYWRDTVLYHTPASGNYIRWQLFDRWWTEQFRQNRSWDQVVTALVTATGVNDECAPVNYLTGMFGNPTEIAATTSRIFLGVQIQCAECHNAKTEPWKREQFHEFAAFFGRAKIIQHKDVGGRGTPYAIEGRATGQYSMTDKRNPDHLIPMQPKFLTGESVPADAPDDVRRSALARFMTSPDNPWFARCYVNRIWTSLMGWGFYPSVSDLGAHVTPRHAKVLDLLAQAWTASGYDAQWLFRTIAQTRAYQRPVQPPRYLSSEDVAPEVCPVRLRPEQIFESPQTALGFDENEKGIPAPAARTAPALQRHTGLRNMVYMAFRENPSLPLNEVHGKIPQALLMMNSTLVHKFTSADGKTVLAEMLAKQLKDDEIVAGLYQRILARKPTTEEQGVCKRYIAKVGNRKEALEDIVWSLVNSTEFLIKK